MLSDLPMESIEKLGTYLELKEELSFSLLNVANTNAYKHKILEGIKRVLEKPNEQVFSMLLFSIVEDENIGLAILQEPSCKSILLELKPNDLPHWILSLPVCQPNLAQYVLHNEDYIASLKPEERLYLQQNYPQLTEHFLSPGDTDFYFEHKRSI